ncbi:hypothetical protein BDZ91DRAFT_224827 [Kalaharituber pfeilii]|nr:hypothetical protein BDZ91DRAFT_230797 [Kalaharituber pfeilii]KAF8465749.1 hypothetical protein BDZ91DRAFT_224827 [Kalaharituber pfeilii]
MGTNSSKPPAKPTATIMKSIVEHDGSLFTFARVGKQYAAKNIAEKNDFESIAIIYQQTTGIDPRIIRKEYILRYWASFSGIFDISDKHRFCPGSIVATTESTIQFVFIERIISMTIGPLSRVFFDVTPLRRNPEEEFWAAPYHVYTRKSIDLGNDIPRIILPLNSIKPGRFHFVTKIKDVSWWYNDLLVNTH